MDLHLRRQASGGGGSPLARLTWAHDRFTPTAMNVMTHRHACRFPRTCLAVIGCLAFNFHGGPPRVLGDESLRQRDPIVLAVKQTKPAIVNIHGEKTVTAEGTSAEPGDAGRRVNGMGTGVIIDSRGYVITNHHVVEGVKRISVTTADHDSYIAKLISHDPQTDLAIIKIDADEPLPVMAIGTSSDLMLGETVVAVGNASVMSTRSPRGSSVPCTARFR